MTKLLDPYELKARMFPGLLLLLPVITTLGLILGPKNPLLITLVSILSACGGPYLLANFVRTWGQRAQDDLFRRWGASPSTLALRHRGTHMPEQTKARYHALIGSKLGITMPTASEESADPARADGCYDAAADALRPMTNDKKKYDLLFKELVSYGFNRNAYGSRHVGLIIALLTAMAVLMDSSGAWLAMPDAKHALALLACILMALLWAVHFTERTVQQAGFSYAKRLWEALEKIPKKHTSRTIA